MEAGFTQVYWNPARMRSTLGLGKAMCPDIRCRGTSGRYRIVNGKPMSSGFAAEHRHCVKAKNTKSWLPARVVAVVTVNRCGTRMPGGNGRSGFRQRCDRA